jgi:hypothetical protein
LSSHKVESAPIYNTRALCFILRYIAWFDLERSTARPYVAQPPGLWRDLGEGLVLWIGFQL